MYWYCFLRSGNTRAKEVINVQDEMNTESETNISSIFYNCTSAVELSEIWEVLVTCAIIAGGYKKIQVAAVSGKREG